MEKTRVIVWFSRGAASAVAAKLALEKYGRERVSVVYCDTSGDEHEDGLRFHRAVERWLGITILNLKSTRYAGVDDVIEKRRYMAGPKGALCTVELKKMVRNDFQRADDIHIFGYTLDEQKRIFDFTVNNPELSLDWILRDNCVMKADCHTILDQAGIAQPNYVSA